MRRKRIWRPRWFNIRDEERQYAKFSPALWEEIGGLAEGLGIPMERAVLYFGNSGLRPQTGGCSAAISAGVYGRNYDYRPRYYDARLALIQASGSHASIGASENPTGRLDGMNAHGLVVGLHLVRTRPKYPGLSCALIVRIILDHGYQRRAGTLHTIVGEPAKRRILIGIGGDAAALEEDMLDVSLDEWLRGQDLPVTRLEGQLGGMAHPFEWPRARKKAAGDISARARTR